MNEKSPQTEKDRQPLLKRTELLTQGIESQDIYDSHRLVPNQVFEIPRVTMSEPVVNHQEGIMQSLRGVVSANREWR